MCVLLLWRAGSLHAVACGTVAWERRSAVAFVKAAVPRRVIPEQFPIVFTWDRAGCESPRVSKQRLCVELSPAGKHCSYSQASSPQRPGDLLSDRSSVTDFVSGGMETGSHSHHSMAHKLEPLMPAPRHTSAVAVPPVVSRDDDKTRSKVGLVGCWGVDCCTPVHQSMVLSHGQRGVAGQVGWLCCNFGGGQLLPGSVAVYALLCVRSGSTWLSPT